MANGCPKKNFGFEILEENSERAATPTVLDQGGKVEKSNEDENCDAVPTDCSLAYACNRFVHVYPLLVDCHV